MHRRWAMALLLVILCVAAAGTQTADAQTAAAGSDDARVWLAIVQSSEPSDFETFLRIYPSSLFAPLAKARLAAARARALSGVGSGPAVRADVGRLYRYRNSSRPVEAAGVPVSLDRLHVRLDAPSEAMAAYLPVDDEKLIALCADENGCMVTVGIVGWVDRGLALEAPLTSSGCRIFVRFKDGMRHWQIESSCVQWYALFVADDKGNPTWDDKKPGRYVPYWSSNNGIDGVDRIKSPGDDRSHVLYLGGCILSESPPDPASKGASGLLPDTLPGFYLIAATKGWAGEHYPSWGWPQEASGRACELIIED